MQPMFSRLFCVSALAALLVAGSAVCQQPETVLAEDIVLALVNGEPVTLADVDIKTRMAEKEGLLQNATSELIVERIMLQEAAARGMTLDRIPRQEVLDRMAIEKRKLVQFLGVGSQGALDRLFARKDFNVELEAMVRGTLLLEWLLEDQKRRIIETVNVDEDRIDEEIQAMENEKRAVRVRLIVADRPDLAEEARAAVESGAMTFQEAAAKYSNDKRLADLGGDVGYVERGMVERTLEEVLFLLEPGVLSAVFQTSSGYNVARIEEVQLWKEVPDKLREAIIRKAGITDMVEMLNEWKIETLTKADVHYVVPSMAPLSP